MLEELNQLEDAAVAELEPVADGESLESWRIKFLGTKGRLRQIMPRMKEVPKEHKPAVGQRLNEVKTRLESAFESKKGTLASTAADSGPRIDVTEPGLPMGEGRRHVLSRTIDEITEVFARMGFSVAEGARGRG